MLGERRALQPPTGYLRGFIPYRAWRVYRRWDSKGGNSFNFGGATNNKHMHVTAGFDQEQDFVKKKTGRRKLVGNHQQAPPRERGQAEGGEHGVRSKNNKTEKR